MTAAVREFFTDQLYAALKLIDRGALSAGTRGSMHGEVGQTQFMPKNILAYGTGNLDVAANALNSTANFLKAHGWRAGAGYQPGEAEFRRHRGLECGRGLSEGDRPDGPPDRRGRRNSRRALSSSASRDAPARESCCHQEPTARRLL